MTVPILSHHAEYCMNMLSDPSALRRDDDDDDDVMWFKVKHESLGSAQKHLSSEFN